MRLHPDSFCTLVALSAEAGRRPNGGLEFRYVVSGRIGDLLLPNPAPPKRADGLWQHSCFEAFLRTADSSYSEFNFSPSSEWAAYGFSDYRSGRFDLPIEAPRIETNRDGERFELLASVDLSGLADLAAATWRLGLSAVIEETNGRKSYWALRHAPGKADFHHPDSFVLELPPA